MQWHSIKTLADLLLLHPRTVKRLYKQIGCPPDMVTEKGKKLWKGHTRFTKCLREYREKKNTAPPGPP